MVLAKNCETVPTFVEVMQKKLWPLFFQTRCSLLTLSMLTDLRLTGLQRHLYLGCSHLAGCVHSSMSNPGANGRVSYDSLTHSRLCCRDSEKKLIMN